MTARAKARWLQGFPDLLLRLHGGGYEVSTRLPVPANLGTPGQRNSKFSGNAGPAIFDVTHRPVLPAAGEPVVVTARAIDPQGITNMTLRYRDEPAAGFLSASMVDDGTGSDAVAGDGVYSARLAGRSTGAQVA